MHKLKFFSNNIRHFKMFVRSITHVGKLSKDEMIILTEEMYSHNEVNFTDRYKLTKNPLGKSGYAFGLCQHDTSTRSDARAFIKACLENAALLSLEEIQNIVNKLSNYKETLSESQLSSSNKSLETEENKKAIDKFDSDYIDAEIEHVASVVSEELKGNIGEKVKKNILEIPSLFLQLVDYHNQFGLDQKGPLIKFLKGESVDRSDLEPRLVAKIDTSKLMGDRLLKEIRKFINQYTKYGREHPEDCARRQSNIDHLNYDLKPSHPPTHPPKKSQPPQPGLPPKPPRPSHGNHPQPGNPSQPGHPNTPTPRPGPGTGSGPYPFPHHPGSPNPVPTPNPPTAPLPPFTPPTLPHTPTPQPVPPPTPIPTLPEPPISNPPQPPLPISINTSSPNTLSSIDIEEEGISENMKPRHK